VEAGRASTGEGVHGFGKRCKSFFVEIEVQEEENSTERRAQHAAPLQGNKKNRRSWRAAARKLQPINY
jgi:hypothetical protein